MEDHLTQQKLAASELTLRAVKGNVEELEETLETFRSQALAAQEVGSVGKSVVVLRLDVLLSSQSAQHYESNRARRTLLHCTGR